MHEDPIVAEVRKYREQHAAKYGNDLKEICKALRQREATSSRELVERAPRLRLPKTGS